MADDNVSDFEIDFTEDSEEILRRLEQSGAVRRGREGWLPGAEGGPPG